METKTLEDAMKLHKQATELAENVLKDIKNNMTPEGAAHFQKKLKNDKSINDMLAIAKSKGINIDGFKI